MVDGIPTQQKIEVGKMTLDGLVIEGAECCSLEKYGICIGVLKNGYDMISLHLEESCPSSEVLK